MGLKRSKSSLHNIWIVPREFFRVNHIPYTSNHETKEQEAKFKQRQDFISNSYHNFLVKRSKLFPISDYENRAHFFLRKRTRELCQDTFIRPAYLEKELRCIYLDHDNPFLRLSPFKVRKFECLSVVIFSAHSVPHFSPGFFRVP